MYTTRDDLSAVQGEGSDSASPWREQQAIQYTIDVQQCRRGLLSPSFDGEVELARVLTRLPSSARLPLAISAASNLATPASSFPFHLLPLLSFSPAVRRCKFTTLVLSVS
jgi:hypothetical protein